MRETIDITEIPVDNVTMNEALEIIKGFLNTDGLKRVYTPNAEIMMAAQREPYLKEILRGADLLVPDGAGVVLASKILRPPLKERVAGFDLTMNLFKYASSEDKNIKFFFLGGKPGVAQEAYKKLKEKNINIEVAGIQDGYYPKENEQTIIDNINSSGANVLLVALGAPRQEKWIHENKDRLNVNICIGVGGTFDVLAEKAKRAPQFFQKNGLEWLYRLYKEPWRFVRMLDLPRFIILVVAKKLKLR